MRLLKLHLRNFKGIRDFTFEPGGGNASVFGANATGKTSLYDAFLWLLFDKDSQNKKDFQIKTLDADGNVLHGLEHEVEGAFDVGGRPLTLRKVFAEKWTQKRGSISKEFSGHTSDYFIDGVPVAKKEFDLRISQIVNEDIFKLLTNPAYFNEQLHWTDRRKIILSVAGDISDADVIAADKQLERLPGILNGRKLDDHRKVIAARRTEINKELEKIPVRIDEAQRMLPDIGGSSAAHIITARSTLTSALAELRRSQQDKRQEITRVEAGGQIAEKQLQLRKIEGQLVDLLNKHKYALNEKSHAKKAELDEANRELQSIEGIIARHSRTLQANAGSVQTLEQKLEGLRKTWHAINDHQFELKQETVCPACGQDLPAERLQAARDKALEEFNLNKAQRLEENDAAGMRAKTQLDELKHENATLQKDIDQLKDDKAEAEKHIAALRAELDAITAAAGDVTASPEYAQALAAKAAVEGEIAALAAGNTDVTTRLKGEISAVDLVIGEKERQLAAIDQHEAGQKRIEELKQQEKALAAEFERLEGELYLTEQFVRTKVNLLEQRINSKFKYARFKLFEQQINGGVTECCETTFGGVPYAGGLNNAARINVGLDIINTLSQHYNFAPPIFIDNAEAVCELIGADAQVIRLVVLANVQELTVWRDGETMPAALVKALAKEMNLKEAM